VTDDDGLGSGRDQRILIWPTFATYSRAPRRLNPLRVSLIDCRPRFDRNRGWPILRPLRLPETESNQFR